jgi:hypothetical protein
MIYHELWKLTPRIRIFGPPPLASGQEVRSSQAMYYDDGKHGSSDVWDLSHQMLPSWLRVNTQMLHEGMEQFRRKGVWCINRPESIRVVNLKRKSPLMHPKFVRTVRLYNMPENADSRVTNIQHLAQVFPLTTALMELQVRCNIELVVFFMEEDFDDFAGHSGYSGVDDFSGFEVFSLFRTHVSRFEIELRGNARVHDVGFRRLNKSMARVGETVLGERVKKGRAFEKIFFTQIREADQSQARDVHIGESRWRYTFERGS